MEQQLIKFIVGAILLGFSILFDIIALAVPSWRVVSQLVFLDTNYGLWEVCANGICQDLPVVSSAVKLTRAMLILGLFAAVGAVTVAALREFLLKDDKYAYLYSAAAGLAYGAGILMLIGVIVYAVDISNFTGSTFTYGAGFALAIVAAVFSEASGGVFTANKLQ